MIAWIAYIIGSWLAADFIAGLRISSQAFSIGGRIPTSRNPIRF